MERNIVMGSHETYYKDLDTDRESGCIRSVTTLTVRMEALQYCMAILQQKDVL